MLYVGKAKNISKRIVAYARPTGHDTRIERMIAATARAGIRPTGDRDRGAASRSQPDQAAAPALQCAAARRQIVSLHPDHRGSLGAADPQASRRADAPGRLLRAVRVRLGGQPHHHRSAARIPAALLLGRFLREPHAARACSIRSSAAPAPAPARSTSRLRASSCARRTRSCPARARPSRTSSQPRWSKPPQTLDFERAAIYRDRLAALSAIQSHQGINPRGVEEADVFAVHQEGGFSCVEVFFFRAGQNWGNRAYFPKADRSLSAPEVLGSFLAQFYDDKPPAAVSSSRTTSRSARCWPKR